MKNWRRFLNMRILLALFGTVLILALVSCGSDDPTDPVDPAGSNGDDPIDYPELTVESVTGSLEAVESAATLFYDTLEAQGAEAAALAAKAFLEAQPAVEFVTIEEDNSLSVTCVNGIVISLGGVTWDRVDPGKSVPAEPLELVTKNGGEATPSSVVLAPSSAELFNTDLDNIASMIDTCLGGPIAATEIFKDGQVTVAKVQEVLQSGYGLIFWVGHGEIVDGACHLVTGEVYNTEAMAQQAVANYEGDLLPGDAGRLLSISHGWGTTKWKLCVAPAFVQKYGNFNFLEGIGGNQVKSIAYISACYSVVGMKDAFLAAGTDVYLGWTWAVSDEFGANFDKKLVSMACDTATIDEALTAAIGEYGRTDPDPYRGRNARIQMWGDGSVMIRAQMRLTKEGDELRGYSVGVFQSSPNSVACFAGDDIDQIQYSVTCNFPDQGSWDCSSDEDAQIVYWDLLAGKMFIVSKDCFGVSGTIDVTDFGGDKTAGKFSGTLGYWGYSSNPETDPPIETLEITNGTFKYTGPAQ